MSTLLAQPYPAAPGFTLHPAWELGSQVCTEPEAAAASKYPFTSLPLQRKSPYLPVQGEEATLHSTSGAGGKFLFCGAVLSLELVSLGLIFSSSYKGMQTHTLPLCVSGGPALVQW